MARRGKGQRRCLAGKTFDIFIKLDFCRSKFFPRLTFPDWLVVKHLGECMDKDNFADLINMMANNLDDVDVDEVEEEVGPPRGLLFLMLFPTVDDGRWWTLVDGRKELRD